MITSRPAFVLFTLLMCAIYAGLAVMAGRLLGGGLAGFAALIAGVLS